MAGYSLEQQRQHILTLLSMIRSLKQDSEFVEGGRNLILSDAEARRLAQTDMLKAEVVVSRTLHNCFGMMWAYAEALHFVAHELSVEMHGPYPYDRDTVVVVAIFFSSSLLGFGMIVGRCLAKN